MNRRSLIAGLGGVFVALGGVVVAGARERTVAVKDLDLSSVSRDLDLHMRASHRAMMGKFKEIQAEIDAVEAGFTETIEVALSPDGSVAQSLENLRAAQGAV